MVCPYGCTGIDIWHNDPCPRLQCDAAYAFRIQPYPLPKSGSLWGEPPKREQPKGMFFPLVWLEHLQAGKVGVHDRDSRIEDALIEKAGTVFLEQAFAELL